MNIFLISLRPGVSETVSYMIICMLLVIGVLWVLSFATSLVGLPFKLKDAADAKKQAAAKAKAEAEAKARALEAAKESSKVATLVSSAVYATMDGAPHRVISITPASADAGAALSSEVAAVISAAVFTALEGKAFSIKSIKYAPDFNWASSGRAAIFASKTPKL